MLDDDDRILEGAASNFYAIVARPGGPRLVTEDDEILPGIARSIVLEVAPDVIPVELVAPLREEIERFSEAFVTSASRGIVPVVEIDGWVVGGGLPGPVTRELIARYDERARELEEPLCGGASA